MKKVFLLLSIFCLMFTFIAIDESLPRSSGRSKKSSQEQKSSKDYKQRGIELPVSADRVLITRAVPDYSSGTEIKDYSSAFKSWTVEAKDGKVILDLTTVPVFVEEAGIQTGTFAAEESPFGIHGIRRWDDNLKELGVQWIRFAGPQGVTWGLVEPEKGKFDWSMYDKLYLESFKNNVEMLITVKCGNTWDQGIKRDKRSQKRARGKNNLEQGVERKKKSHKGRRGKPGMPHDIEAYSNFIHKMVERYDGDGTDDAPGAPTIKYWQIQNEVDGSWGDTPQDYAVLLKTSYMAIKEADPKAKIVLAGVMSREGFRNFYVPMLEHLNKIRDNPSDMYFDIFDFHWGGAAGSYKEKDRHGDKVDFKQYTEEIRSVLKKYNFSVPIWITEISTYSGRPESPPGLQEQSEETQATELVKLYVYPLALGAKKIFWVSLKEWGTFNRRTKGYFNMVGLISNPRNEGDSYKKLAYYTYKMLIEKLGGIDLDKIQTINIGEGIYCFKFIRKNSKSIYILWYDYNKQ